MLVAINPFKEVPLYGNDYIDAYKRKSIENPHVYAIADTAIREMIRGEFSFCLSDWVSGILNSYSAYFVILPDEVNQSIIIRLV